MNEIVIYLFEKLFSHYGDLSWWPAKSPYEVIAGAILTQNTSWSNVERALANFKCDITPELIEQMPIGELSEVIKPAGFYNQKAVYLKAVTSWFAIYSYDIQKVKEVPLSKIRSELLRVKGVGEETADSILLYAFDLPTFVVDKYTARFLERFPIYAGTGYKNIKAFIEASLPKKTVIYNHFHALIVINAKEHCKAKPECELCPLMRACMKIGTNT